MSDDNQIKLVRDKVVDLLPRAVAERCYQVEDQPTKHQLLIAKLHEEVAEYVADTDRLELVDIIEVVYALAQSHGWSMHDVEVERARKEKARGSFQQGWVMPLPADPPSTT